MEGWPSGLRRTPGKRVNVNAFRRFESYSLRHYLKTIFLKILSLDKLFPSSSTGRAAGYEAAVIGSIPVSGAIIIIP